MVAFRKPLFNPGRVVATPGALDALAKAGQQPSEFLDRHIVGDWGTLDDDDRRSNDEAVWDGSRILSAYILKTNEKIWIITEAEDKHGQRASTTLLLAEEY
jgi:hypothetical protein